MAGSRTPGPLGISGEAPDLNDGTLVRAPSPLPGPVGVAPAPGGASTKGSAVAQTRLNENTEYLRNANVKAFIGAIAAAEGGDYNLKFGGVKGKKNDKWQFTDYGTHPGVGSDGKTTAAGMYQINKSTWKEMGGKMGLTDFSPATQDLLAVEILRTIHVIDDIVAGDVNAALKAASRRWAALPQGPKLGGRYDQPYMPYDEFISAYKRLGGTAK
ncbi:glycoside hydrolase family 24 protein [Niveibacterium microcysteis]|uniref:Glycoside hydrolase family 104 protein n=1 Tax=Niveibacterium microcysteis TaxID=2811415 RepID=A0ABX7MCR4_9RHOO|nr:glycoside hydrolase family 104 protein [Niveibacterium microcysteis]QSI78613.1 glycoside hydrolase family 104 protein [Niveibacterium microcysteis]